MEIKKIIINFAPGYGCESYKDKLVITSQSISFEHDAGVKHPDELIEWSYMTTSSAFAEQFGMVAEAADHIIKSESGCFADDGDYIEIAAVYDDKQRESIDGYCAKEYYGILFYLVKQMLPPCEIKPAFLELEEDNTEDEDE